MSEQGYSMILGPSTKVQQIAGGEKVAFTREALESAAKRADGTFIPNLVEHLHYLPPIGRISRVHVTEIDGEAYLAADSQFLAAAETPDMALQQVETTDDGEVQFAATIATEPRNWTEEDFAELESEGVPLGRTSLNSALPPLIWSVVLVVPTLAALASKSFIGSFFSKLGTDSAGGLIRWIAKSSETAKENTRDQLFEVRFELDSGVAITAICPFDPTNADSLDELRSCLERLTDFAAFQVPIVGVEQSSQLRQAAFIWTDGQWKLAWWATDLFAYSTPWLRLYAPDPKRFLAERPPTLAMLRPHAEEADWMKQLDSPAEITGSPSVGRVDETPLANG